MRLIILAALIITAGISLCYRNWTLPKWIYWLIPPGFIITFLLIPSNILYNNILDINHPVYTDGGISTLAIITSLLIGSIPAGIIALIYRLISPIIYKYRYNKKGR